MVGEFGYNVPRKEQTLVYIEAVREYTLLTMEKYRDLTKK